MKKLITTPMLVLCFAGNGMAQVGEGDAAPAFEFAESLSPGIKNFKALRGKVLMLDFFATW